MEVWNDCLTRVDPMVEEAFIHVDKRKSLEEKAMIENTDSAQIEKMMLESKDFRDKIPDQYSAQIEKIMLESKDFRDKIPDQEMELVSLSTSSKVLGTEMPEDRPASSTDEAAISIRADKMVESPKFQANGDTKHGNQQKAICSEVDKKAEVDKTAVTRLFEICAANNWVAPKFVLCKVDDLIHQRRYTYKATVEIENISSTLLESFSEPRSQKIDAREHAAEGALWFLKHLGHT